MEPSSESCLGRVPGAGGPGRLPGVVHHDREEGEGDERLLVGPRPGSSRRPRRVRAGRTLDGRR